MQTRIDDFDRRCFFKTIAIGAGCCALGSILARPEILMGATVQDNLSIIPMDARWEIACVGFVNTQVMNFKTLYDKEGAEKFKMIMENSAFGMGHRNKAIADRFGFTGIDAQAVAAMVPAVISIFYGPKQTYKTLSSTAEKAAVQCLDCAFGNAVQSFKITDDICSTLSQYYWDGFAKAVNPKLAVNLVKARPFGDSVCEWEIELTA